MRSPPRSACRRCSPPCRSPSTSCDGPARSTSRGSRWSMWRASDEPEATVAAPHSTPRAMYRQGLLTRVLNPKVAVFQLALFPQFVDPARGSVLLQSLVLAVTQLVIVVAGDSVCVLRGHRCPALVRCASGLGALVEARARRRVRARSRRASRSSREARAVRCCSRPSSSRSATRCARSRATSLRRTPRAWDRDHTFPRDALRALGALGVLGIVVPEAWGGAGLDYVSPCRRARGDRRRRRRDVDDRQRAELGRLRSRSTRSAPTRRSRVTWCRLRAANCSAASA